MVSKCFDSVIQGKKSPPNNVKRTDTGKQEAVSNGCLGKAVLKTSTPVRNNWQAVGTVMDNYITQALIMSDVI